MQNLLKSLLLTRILHVATYTVYISYVTLELWRLTVLCSLISQQHIYVIHDIWTRGKNNGHWNSEISTKILVIWYYEKYIIFHWIQFFSWLNVLRQCCERSASKKGRRLIVFVSKICVTTRLTCILQCSCSAKMAVLINSNTNTVSVNTSTTTLVTRP